MTDSYRETQPRPPILALDLGQKTVGVAVTDELSVTIRRLDPLKRTNWKDLLQKVNKLVERFDAKALVIGLPLSLDGTAGSAAQSTRKIARNFAKSLSVPVYLQDERLTSREAKALLREQGCTQAEIQVRIDSESAAIILRDFVNSREEKLKIAEDGEICATR